MHSAGHEAYLVGGCVRDAIMGTEINDFDITTSATPDEMKVAFANERTFDTGIKHGTITLYYNHENIEITTYRVDGEYIDNRHPESVEFTKSLENDLKRRDFTINAIVYNENEGYVDMFGGIADIENKIIRAIGDPVKRFNEDALRILRGIRFCSTLGFKIDESTKQAMLECKELLHNISAERISVEINKMLLGKNVKNAILENYEILGEIIPELKQMQGFDQKNPWHIYDVLTHTAIAVESTPPSLHLRLSALLHDTGKVHTFTTDENGIGHFYGHSEKSTEIAQAYLNNYRYDNATKKKVLKLVKIHDMRIEEDKLFVKKQLNRLGTESFFDLVDLQEADNLAQNPEKTRLEHFKILREIANEILNENECTSLKTLAINGSDLIKDGHTPGKNLGIILDTILSEVIEEKLPNEKEALLKRARELKMENEQQSVISSEEVIEKEEAQENANQVTTPKQKEKMPPKRKALIVLITMIALLVILVPVFFAVTRHYENEVEDILILDAQIYTLQEMSHRYNHDFKIENVVKINYDNDSTLFETKEITSIILRASDKTNNKKYICTVHLKNGEPHLFENYAE